MAATSHVETVSETPSEDADVSCTPRTLEETTTIDLRYKDIRWAPSLAVYLSPQIEAQFRAFEAELSVRHSENTTSNIDNSACLAAGFLGFLSQYDTTKLSTRALLEAFDNEFLSENDVHTISLSLATASSRAEFLANYFAAMRTVGVHDVKHRSKLLDAAAAGQETLFGVFGGQGASNRTCLKELKDLYAIYGSFLDELLAAATEVLEKLATQAHVVEFFEGSGFDVSRWVTQPDAGPSEDQIQQAPFSVPLIGILSFAHFCVNCKVLGLHPGEFRNQFTGMTGHSQGVVAAAMVARSTSWNSFYQSVQIALEVLFCVAFECHENSSSFYPVPTHSLEQCIEAGEGTPSPMLSVRGLDQTTLQAVLNRINQYLQKDEHVQIALINSRKSLVVAGPPRSLCALSAYLRKSKASEGLNQSKMVFDKRKPVIKHQFLPMSSVFHSPLNIERCTSILKHLQSTSVRGNELGVSVYHTATGADLSNLGDEDIIPNLVAMIVTDVVDWPRASCFPDNSTVVDFGPGGISRIMLGQAQGLGIRFISASDLVPSTSIGSKADMFTMRDLPRALHWKKRFQPCAVSDDMGMITIDNRMTRLLGCPPIMVAGMTPTTVPYDFVAEIMKAGYHAELACGGYNSPASLESAIKKLSKEIPSTAGITCNIIYASPKVIAWQIPLIRDLVRRGYPIHGLTIGAGIPSNDVVQEYITTLGLKHISFKPGSVDAIKQVTRIARQHRDFPFGLQWTGGRAGGHHSYEDFHTPILDTYSEIRLCQNIVLIAGSGFGGSEDTYPYLSGDWSLDLGYPAMPFDGVLLGSRVMVAKESHTSPEAKALIVEAPGVSDHEWHKTYSKPTGGIVTVRSEMGQPIHKIATRGVMLWSELDKKFFSISDRTVRLAELRKNQAWIIDRLNKDFQKPWFAINSHGEVVELEDMTYAEVLSRLVGLMYVQHQQRWIDSSYRLFLVDFSQRARERLSKAGEEDLFNDFEHPEAQLAGFLEGFPDAKTEIIHPDDVNYFVSLCKQRGRKPVNFIPVIDVDFETWFKKDSLWQAEDVAALPDQDAQRACIIHGPVAARFSVVQDQPVKVILDSIRTSWIRMIQRTQQLTLKEGVQVAQDAAQAAPSTSEQLSSLLVEDTATRKRYRFPTTGALPEGPMFREELCRQLSGWALDAVQGETIRQGQHNRPNPLRSVLVPTYGHDLVIEYDPVGQVSTISMNRQASIYSDVIQIIEDFKTKTILATLSTPTRAESKEARLQFRFRTASHAALVKLEEDPAGRNQAIKDFYAKLWLPHDESHQQIDCHRSFSGVQTALTSGMVKGFLDAVGSKNFGNGSQVVPIDICIVVAWEAIVKPLLSAAIDCDILQLLHRSNEFRYVEGVEPLRIGDVLTSTSRIQSVNIHHGNKIVEVLAEVCRSGVPVVYVLSKFFCKGPFDDLEKQMRHVREPRYDVTVRTEVDAAILLSREWLQFDQEIAVGQVLSFDVTTEAAHDTKSHCDRLKVSGSIMSRSTEASQIVGEVSFEGLVRAGNPVLDFLNRHGSQTQKIVPLRNSGLEGQSTWNLQALRSNASYAKASKDNNPIHTSPVFARFAHLDSIVNHGMGTSAIVLRSLEKNIGESDPSRIRRYSASFEGKVLPGDELIVKTEHIGMQNGLMVLAVTASNAETGETVLKAEADIKQPKMAYLFTGQGSQEKGMGMQLYDTSKAARDLWDRADKNLYNLYGFSILEIVRNDPKSITIHFKGARGRQIRDNYLALTLDGTDENGKLVREPLIKELTPTSQSYTFADQRGLLYSTQFAQPAITLTEMATIVDLESKGLIQKDATYAGHSLGEYSALGAIAGVISMESMVNLVFYRGLTMQTAMQRDAHGRTEFSMMAVNPSRVASVFGQASIESLVTMITNEMGILLEIVNFNVQGRQYVCAGHLRALWTLSQVLNSLAAAKISKLPQEAQLLELVKEKAEASLDLAEPIELERGHATVPLRGIDIPFHSRYLRHGIPAYRRYLETQIREEDIDVDKLAAFVPNVTAKPFSIDRAYVQEAAELTNSKGLRTLLADVSHPSLYNKIQS